MKRWLRLGLLTGAALGSSLVGSAADAHLTVAQLTTYVKPIASGTEAHSVGLVGTLGEDGMLHDLAAVDAGDQLVTPAKAAAAQWVYVPFKRGEQAVAVPVFVMVAVGGADHVAVPKEPVLLSTRLVGVMMVKRTAALPPQAGARGMVPVATTLGRDGVVEKAQGMAGPEMFRLAAERAVKQSSYRVLLFDGVPVMVGTTIPMMVGQ